TVYSTTTTITTDQHAPEPIHKPAPASSHPALRPFHPHIFLTPASSSPGAQQSIPTSNLLLLLPGLGDSPASYTSLATSLQRTLPQTCILILRPPQPIPLLADPENEDVDQAPHAWWDAFDLLTGDFLPPQAQNPGRCLAQLGALLDYLTAPVAGDNDNKGCGWPPHSVHLFGYGQGGTAAMEAAISWVRSRRAASNTNSSPSNDSHELGSVVSVCGPLLSSPGSLSAPRPISVPVLSFLRHPNADQNSAQAKSERSRLLAAFKPVSDAQQVVVVLRGNEDAMLKGKDEFDRLMKFWSSVAQWRNRSSWEYKDEGVYRVG
ncbi:unnamed protein product, partial [Tilletia caries]